MTPPLLRGSRILRIVGYAARPAVLIDGDVAKDGFSYQVALGFEFFDEVLGPYFQLDIHG